MLVASQEGFAKFIVNYDEAEDASMLSVAPNKPMDIEIPLTVCDAIHNFSCCLDHISSELAAIFKGDIRRVHFPFHEKKDQFIDLLNNNFYFLPDEIIQYFRLKILPYRTGNFPLWAMRKLDNINKHRLIPMFIGFTEVRGIFYKSTLGHSISGGPNLRARADRVSHFIKIPGRPLEAGCEGTSSDLYVDEPEYFDAPAPIFKILPLAMRAADQVMKDLTTLLYGDKKFPKIIDSSVFRLSAIGR